MKDIILSASMFLVIYSICIQMIYFMSYANNPQYITFNKFYILFEVIVLSKIMLLARIKKKNNIFPKESYFNREGISAVAHI